MGTEHNMRVACMVDGVMNAHQVPTSVRESDGKIHVVEAETGKIIFETTALINTSWKAWQHRQSEEHDEDLSRWDAFSEDLSNDLEESQTGLSVSVHDDADDLDY